MPWPAKHPAPHERLQRPAPTLLRAGCKEQKAAADLGAQGGRVAQEALTLSEAYAAHRLLS